MNTIEITIGANKVAAVTIPQILVEGENRTTQIVVVTPAAWEGYTVQCLLTTPKGELVDPIDSDTPIELLNTMLDGPGTLKAEFLATSGTDVERTKNAALMNVLAARDPLGTIAPEPLPDFIAQMVVVKDQASSAASNANAAAYSAAQTEEDIEAAEAEREEAESGRSTAEGLRASAESTRGTNETGRVNAELIREANELARESEKISGNTGKKYRIIACVLRNEGAGWSAIDDANHAPVGVASITSDTNVITINHDFTATKIGSLVCTPDEYFSEMGYSFGASVGVSISNIKIAQNRTIAGYISFNGTSWTIGAGSVGITSVTFSGGNLKITHENIGTTFARNVFTRDGGCLANLGTVAADYSRVEFRAFDGSLITTPTTACKIYFSATCMPAKNPNEVISAGGNIWVHGIFEVD